MPPPPAVECGAKDGYGYIPYEWGPVPMAIACEAVEDQGERGDVDERGTRLLVVISLAGRVFDALVGHAESSLTVI